VLLPAPCQQHGGMLTEVLVHWENENYEDKMTKENDFPFTSFPLALSLILTRLG
jgi:hypothetical protein